LLFGYLAITFKFFVVAFCLQNLDSIFLQLFLQSNQMRLTDNRYRYLIILECLLIIGYNFLFLHLILIDQPIEIPNLNLNIADFDNKLPKITLLLLKFESQQSLLLLVAATSLSLNLLILDIVHHHLLELFEMFLVHLRPMFGHLPRLALAQPQHHFLHLLQQPLLCLDLLLELLQSASTNILDLLGNLLAMLVNTSV